MVYSNDRKSRSFAMSRSVILRFATSTFVIFLGLACAHPAPPAPPPPPFDVPPDAGLNSWPEHDATRIWNYVNNELKWDDTGTDIYLTCRPTECGQATGGRVHLLVTLHRDTHLINPEDAINPNRPGHIVAKIENLTPYPVAEYGFRGNDVAYLWIGRTASKPPAFAIYRFGNDPATGERTIIGMSYSRKGLKCTDASTYPPERVHVFTPSYCPGYTTVIYQRAASLPPQNIVTAVSNVLHPRGEDALYNGEGLWFSCSLGCCQATDFSFY